MSKADDLLYHSHKAVMHNYAKELEIENANSAYNLLKARDVLLSRIAQIKELEAKLEACQVHINMRDVLLNEIGLQVQQWLDLQEKERKEEGLNIDDTVALMSVPVWPSRGTLKEWVKILRREDMPARSVKAIDPSNTLINEQAN